MARNLGNAAVDRGCPQIRSDVDAIDEEAGDIVAVGLADLDAGGLGQGCEAVFVVEVDAPLEGEPGDGAIHHAGVDEAIPELAGKAMTDDRLAGGDRSVNRNESRVRGS